MSKRIIKNRIKEILEEKHISPYRLAKLLNCPAPTVYNWCNNKSNPSQNNLVEIMKFLGVRLDDIYEVTEE